MPRWVDDSGRPVTPELILGGKNDLRTHTDGSLHSLIDVRNVNEDDHRRAPASIRRAADHNVRERRLNHEERAIDTHRYVNWRPIRLWQTNIGNTACTPSGIDSVVAINLSPERSVCQTA
jgi:hypothetical protein